MSANIGTYNAAFGYAALQSAQGATAQYNTAVGHGALSTLQTGMGNTALGDRALEKYEGFGVSNGNTALGVLSMGNLTGNVSSYNTAVGYQSLFTPGLNSYGNTTVGYQSMLLTTTGIYNTAIGAYALLNITNGANNVALGFRAGQYITGGSAQNQTSSGSIYLGSDTRASANGNSNEIVIGNAVTGNGTNTTTIGNTLTSAAYIKGTLNISAAVNIKNGTEGVVISAPASNGYTQGITIDQPNMQIKFQNGNADNGAGMSRPGVGNFSRLNIWSGKGQDNNGVARRGYITFQTGDAAGTLVTRLVVDSIGGILLPTLNSGVTTEALYWDASTKEVTHGSVTARASTKENIDMSGSFSQTVVNKTTFNVELPAGTSAGYKIQVTPTSKTAASVFYVDKKATSFDVVFTAELTGLVSFDWEIQ